MHRARRAGDVAGVRGVVGLRTEVRKIFRRSVRGYTVVAALLDELAFWRSDESANPDTEIISAIRPAMATIPNAMLLCASSPYAQRGALFDAFKRHHGKASPVLVWRAPTRAMNPTVPQSVVDAAIEADPASAAAEYMAQWRIDVQTFVARDVVEAGVIASRHELLRVEHTRYFAFVDPSGHMRGNRVIVDAIRARRSRPTTWSRNFPSCSRATASARWSATSTPLSGRASGFGSTDSSTASATR
jgi:hypothetical protein